MEIMMKKCILFIDLHMIYLFDKLCHVSINSPFSFYRLYFLLNFLKKIYWNYYIKINLLEYCQFFEF